MLLRVAKGYEELLGECCGSAAPGDCLRRGVGAARGSSRGILRAPGQQRLQQTPSFQEEELQKHIYETEGVMKTSCDIYKEKGDYYFQNE